MNKTQVLIIAEAGVNHNGDLALAKKLIEVAAAAGADYVKFQTFLAKNLVSAYAKKAKYQIENLGAASEDDTQYSMLKQYELSPSDHATLIAHCKACGIRFLSTAFDLESLDLLRQIDLDLYKIPSGEITNLPYLKELGRLGKPIVLSTGMATLEDIEAAIQVLQAAGADRETITVLHCNTEYPTPMEDVNLRAMQTIQTRLGVAIGYSDHTLGIEVPVAAVALGAVCIEKHFTLDRSMPGPDHAASLEPEELKAMVKAIRNIEKALGHGLKTPSPSEIKNMAIARKSIHLAHDLAQGTLLSEADLVMKRPGDGLSPMELPNVLGKRLKYALAADHKLDLKDLA